MATSAKFAQQMDRIILICRGGVTQRVLHSIVTKDVWFRRPVGGGHAAAAIEDKSMTVVPSGDVDNAAPVEAPVYEFTSEDANEHDTPVEERGSMKEEPSIEPPPVAKNSPAALRQSQAPSSVSVSPSAAAMKRRAPAEDAPSIAKKQRSSAPTTQATTIVDKRRDERAEMEEKRDDEETEEEEETDQRAGSSNTTTQDAAAALPAEPVAREHLGDLLDFLINYDDSIRDSCYVRRRSPAQTKFFKEHLRKAIRLVDAQLYKPRQAKCRVARGGDPQSALSKRVLRAALACPSARDRVLNGRAEALHPAVEKAKRRAKQREFEIIQPSESHPNCERERLLEVTLVRNDLTEIETKLSTAEEELESLEDSVSESWKCLNEVGINAKDDETDGLPDLDSYYRNVQKGKASERRSRDTERRNDVRAGASVTPRGQCSLRQTRRASSMSTLGLEIEVINVASEEEETESGENSSLNRVVKQETDGSSAQRRKKT